MSGIMGIGVSGIRAAQMGLLITQHNIANASTSGYNRQAISQATTLPLGERTGFVGTGVQVSTVGRQYNSFLSSQVSQSQAEYSSLDTYFGQISVVDDLLADANAGVSPALQDFFKGVQQVASTPASLPARQAMLSSAEALVSRFQGADQRISDLYGLANQQVADTVSVINSYSQQIATLNQRIASAQASFNQPPNDLLDQRDQLLGELNKLMKVSIIDIGNGGIEVSIGQGQLLVAGDQANNMSAVKSSADPSRTMVAIDTPAGKQELPEGSVTGGELGGLLKFRSETLDHAVNSLGRVAASLALAFNAQHAVGMDMLGNNAGDAGFASDFFVLPEPKVISKNSAAPAVRASFAAPELSSPTNTGNYFTHLTTSDYRLDYRSAQFTLTRLEDGAAWQASDLDTLNTLINNPNDSRGAQGITLTGPAAGYAEGDSYLIEPTREIAKGITVDTRVAGDVRLIAAGSPIRAETALANQGTMQASITRMTAKPALATYPIEVTFNGGLLSFGDGTVTMVKADQTTVSGNPVEFDSNASYEIDGVMFSLRGNPKDGDVFRLRFNDGRDGAVGVSDSSNIVLLGKLQTQQTTAGGSATFQAAYAQLVSDIGNRAREVEVTRDAQKSMLDQATTAREEFSGVNLDEEAANLLKYQQMYQAAARSITVGKEIFDELLSAVRG